MRRARAYYAVPSFCGFDRIPTEILEIILQEACDDFTLALPPHPPRRNRNPYTALVISWVCHQWRAMVLSSATLWTPARIDINFAFCEYDRKRTSTEALERARVQAKWAALLQCYLERSDSAPLTVRLQGCLRDEDREWSGPVADIVHIVFATIPRWQECVIAGYVVDILVTAPEPVGFPLLEVATVHMDDEFDPAWSVVDFSRAPRLRSYEGPITTLGLLPHGQLTCLRMNTCVLSVQMLMDLIPLARQLQMIEVIVCLDPSEPLPPLTADAICLPQLWLAEFTVDSYDVLAHIFGSLTTPKLSTLAIKGRTQDMSALSLEHWPMIEFDTWLRRSSCHLEHLDLISVLMPQTDIVAIMQRLPSLTELGLHDSARSLALAQHSSSSVDDALLRNLTAKAESKPELLPALSKLALSGNLQCDYALLLDMVSSRTSPRIEVLRLEIGDGSTSDIDDATEMRLRDMLGDDDFHVTRGLQFNAVRNPWKLRKLQNRTGETDTESEGPPETSEDSDDDY
ncbi:hypothetical protein HDZ31DRAFT_31999 [Schizophyllum fasciatum]